MFKVISITIICMFLASDAAWSQNPVVVTRGDLYLHSFGATAGAVAIEFDKTKSRYYTLATKPYSLDSKMKPGSKSLYTFSLKPIYNLVRKYNNHQRDPVRFRMIPPKISFSVAYKK